jgi:UDPglucose 6-dehydrogenase
MSIAVIGQGFVGGSLTTVFAERGETVYVYDKLDKVAHGGMNGFHRKATGETVYPRSIAEFVNACEGTSGFSGVYFVCVPTPMYEDGSPDTSIVEDVLELLSAAPYSSDYPDRIAVVKSTVPPGSTEKWNKAFGDRGLHVVFNPEFLTEANAVNDMREQNRIVLGGPRPFINTVRNVFQRAFPKIPIIKTSSTTAEMVKYVTNCMLAVKVSFANEVAQICEALDADGLNIDYDKVVEYAKVDRRLGDTHWSVPGPVPTHDGRYVRGFGGHCFPKDINALMSVARQYDVEPTVMQAAWNKNLEVRAADDRDWEKQLGRAVSKRKQQ